MAQNHWIVKETYQKWREAPLRSISPQTRSYQYFFSSSQNRLLMSDLFLGLTEDESLLLNVGVALCNSFSTPQKYAVYLQPRYYFKRSIPFKNLRSLITLNENERLFTIESPLCQLNEVQWHEILSFIREIDPFGVEIIQHLHDFNTQREYLEAIVAILDRFQCDVNERQEVFLILRNLLNWNPEYLEGRTELEEMFSFLKYSLHIEDFPFEERLEILDDLLSNWMRYVNHLPKRLIEHLQNIKNPFLL